MNDRAVEWLVTVNAIVGAGAGLLLLIVAGPFLSLLGMATDPVGTTFVRLYGAELVGFSVATWLVRRTNPPPRPIVAGHIANESLTAIVVALAAASGLGNPLVWPFAAVAALFAAGYIVLATRRTSTS